ncbi:MAG: LysM peptidoglycan-binding domain-containing protein [Acidobacteria bacterium]|nr:LysM peptidoglycan-binding domain-containing protein [Acidobacteriota bacterium]
MLLATLMVGVLPAKSQSLGELARRERERKAAAASPAARIYTNEDLQRAKIVEPQEASLIGDSLLRATELSAEPIPEEPHNAGAVAWPPGTPLGDVARHYLNKKERKKPEQHLVQTVGVKAAQPLEVIRHSQRRRVAVAPERPQPKDFPQQAEVRGSEENRTGEWIRVERGDSLWRLASRYLGNGAEWPRILKANPALSDPNRIRAGQSLRLPSRTAAPTSLKIQQVRVQPGDSLWSLARSRYGDGQAWSCIAAVNPAIDDANWIYAGQLLIVPATCQHRS